jgi:hypothetical protein
MSEVRATIEAVNFKKVPGGYVYRAPGGALFGPVRYYLANEAQKAEIVSIITPRRPVLRHVMAWVALVAMVAAGGTIVWACTGHDDPTTADVFVWIMLVIVQILAALLIMRWRIRHRLQPLIAGLPPSDDRITFLEMRQALATAQDTTSVKQLAFAGASSVFAFTAFLMCFVFDLTLGLHLAIMYFSGTVVFGCLAVVWFRRLIRKAEPS